MPVYAYKGVSEAGKAIRGFVDAESDRGARAKLRRDGVFLTELSAATGGAVRPDETSPRHFSLEVLRRVGGTDLAIATRQLATLIGADGTLQSKGLVNTREHLESLIEAMDTGIATLQDYVGQAQQDIDHSVKEKAS